MTAPVMFNDINLPGSPLWWLERLIPQLLDRQRRFDVLEDYALGNHPLPIGDIRFNKALKELQYKARTNYCELVIRATTERMKVRGFRFGPAGEADKDAKSIWDFSDMDIQSPMILNTAATFGLCYAFVQPPDPNDPKGEPRVTAESPRMCITEPDPARFGRSLAGLKLWQDDILGFVMCLLMLPEQTFLFRGPSIHPGISADSVAMLTRKLAVTPTGGGFELVAVEANPIGEVPLVEGNWQPSFGVLGRAEHEPGLDIQDRINYTVLTRMVVSHSQAYRQRWGTGMTVKTPKKGQRRVPFDPGADMLWVTADPNARFGDFEQADITQLLAAVRDDVGDFAAVTQTPGTYLMNRMVNVSGDTLTQDQSALVQKVKLRSEPMGWFYERIIKICFKYKGDTEKAASTEASTLWADPEIHSMAEMADAVGKMAAAEIPLQLIMERTNFTPDEIAFAIEEREKQRQEQKAREDEVATREADTNMALAEQSNKGRPGGSQK